MCWGQVQGPSLAQTPENPQDQLSSGLDPTSPTGFPEPQTKLNRFVSHCCPLTFSYTSCP